MRYCTPSLILDWTGVDSGIVSLFLLLFFISLLFFFCFSSFIYSCIVLVRYWLSIENRRLYFIRYAEKSGFDPLVAGNWYSLSYTNLKKEKVSLFPPSSSSLSFPFISFLSLPPSPSPHPTPHLFSFSFS